MLADIRARGVEMESLQQDLLDHVCCIIEQNLEANGNFEGFYAATIQTFYKKELKEIEAETLFLLTNKNYYAMKNIMLASGAFSAIILSAGILFKFMHWPGAGVLITCGIGLFSLIFLPLLFLLKVKERQQAINRFSIGIGTLCAIGFSLSTLFKIMHWPGANVLGISAIALMVLVFLPVYFFTGIKHSETKVNTIVTSILVIAGAGLLMSLVRSPGSSARINALNTESYLRNEQLLQNEKNNLAFFRKNSTVSERATGQSQEIYAMCEELKTYILERDTGRKTVPANFEAEKMVLTDGWIKDYFTESSPAEKKLLALREKVEAYNRANATRPAFQPVPVKNTVLDKSEERTLEVLQNLTQMQLQLLQNELVLAAK